MSMRIGEAVAQRRSAHYKSRKESPSATSLESFLKQQGNSGCRKKERFVAGSDRGTWVTVSPQYVRVIPPGASDGGCESDRMQNLIY